MHFCTSCKKQKLVKLTKSFDNFSSCAKCAENKLKTSLYFSPTSLKCEVVSKSELQKTLKDDKLERSDFESCLFYSAKTGRKDLVEVLLDRGINPNSTIFGRSAIIEASENGDEEIVAQLLENGADMNAPDLEGNTAFMFACSNGHFKIAQMLLKHGVCVNARNKQGSTAFLLACTMGQTKIVKLLLAHHADSRVTNFKGQTPLMLASFYGRIQVVKMLIKKADIDINAKDVHQDTALIFAAQRGQQDICQVLIEAGARTNDRNQYNNSAKYYASPKIQFPFHDNVAALICAHLTI